MHLMVVEQCRQAGCFDRKAGIMQITAEHVQLVGDISEEYGTILMGLIQSILD